MTGGPLREDTPLFDLLRAYPSAVEVLRKYGLECCDCMGIEGESVGKAARAHGIDASRLLEELNALLFEPRRDGAEAST